MDIVLVEEKDYAGYTRRLAKELVFHGHDVTIIYPKTPGCDEVFVEEPVTQVALGAESDLEFSYQLHLWLLDKSPHVVEAFSDSFALLVEQLIGSTPTVVRYDEAPGKNSITISPLRKAWSRHLLEMQTVQRSELAISASAENVETARKLGIRCTHIPWGIDENLFKSEDQRDGDFMAKVTWEFLIPLYEEAYEQAMLSAIRKGRAQRW